MEQREKLRNFVLLAAVMLVLCSTAQALDLDRGHRVLLDRGLQLQALAYVVETGYFDLSRWAESNFTTVGLSGVDEYPTPILPAAPGIPWTRWLYHAESYNGVYADIEPSEYPFVSNLINLSVQDEQDITDPAELANLAAAYANMHSLHPNVIMHTNQSGGQFTAAQIRNYMQQTQPDMLMFDHYFFTGNVAGGSPTGFYTYLEKYRELGLAGNDGTGTQPIPTGLYTQTIVWQGHTVSESEIRLNNFGAWAFGNKLVQSFVYENHPALPSLVPVMFSGDGTDNPTAEFYEVAETNRQSLNLGPALVRLLNTDVRMVMGEYYYGGPATNPLPTGVSTWDSGADPYITNITATNPGTLNSGLRGDVVVGYFEVLDEIFDGAATDEIYFMIVNGLSDAVGSAAAVQQDITINFDFGASGITSLHRLSRDTGLVEEVALVSTGGSTYRLDLTLDGGTGDLFKFNTGARFVYDVPGDVNYDSLVGGADMSRIITNWGMSGAIRIQGDVTGDGLVGAADYTKVLSNWGNSTLPPEPPEAPGAIPEPGTLLLLAGGVLSGLIRRRR